jgi:hypothetical protein
MPSRVTKRKVQNSKSSSRNRKKETNSLGSLIQEFGTSSAISCENCLSSSSKCIFFTSFPCGSCRMSGNRDRRSCNAMSYTRLWEMTQETQQEILRLEEALVIARRRENDVKLVTRWLVDPGFSIPAAVLNRLNLSVPDRLVSNSSSSSVEATVSSPLGVLDESELREFFAWMESQ